MLFKYAHPRVLAQAEEGLLNDPQNVGAIEKFDVVFVELAQIPLKKINYFVTWYCRGCIFTICCICRSPCTSW